MTALAPLVSRWGEAGTRPSPLPANDALFADLSCHVERVMACDVARAWQLVTDVERVGRYSPECIGARWLPPSTRAVVGARFEGTNRTVLDGRTYIWIRPCTVVLAEEPTSFGYVVGDRFDGSPASRWEHRIEQIDAGRCRMSLTFRHLPRGLTGLRLQCDADPASAPELVAHRMAELRDGMRVSLQRMAPMLERWRDRSSTRPA
jgi:hypothetical protein